MLSFSKCFLYLNLNYTFWNGLPSQVSQSPQPPWKSWAFSFLIWATLLRLTACLFSRKHIMFSQRSGGVILKWLIWTREHIVASWCVLQMMLVEIGGGIWVLFSILRTEDDVFLVTKKGTQSHTRNSRWSIRVKQEVSKIHKRLFQTILFITLDFEKYYHCWNCLDLLFIL